MHGQNMFHWYLKLALASRVFLSNISQPRFCKKEVQHAALLQLPGMETIV